MARRTHHVRLLSAWVAALLLAIPTWASGSIFYEWVPSRGTSSGSIEFASPIPGGDPSNFSSVPAVGFVFDFDGSGALFSEVDPFAVPFTIGPNSFAASAGELIRDPFMIGSRFAALASPDGFFNTLLPLPGDPIRGVQCIAFQIPERCGSITSPFNVVSGRFLLLTSPSMPTNMAEPTTLAFLTLGLLTLMPGLGVGRGRQA